MRTQAEHLLETANAWKDKKSGILYARETMERNIRDIVPDRQLRSRSLRPTSSRSTGRRQTRTV